MNKNIYPMIIRVDNHLKTILYENIQWEHSRGYSASQKLQETKWNQTMNVKYPNITVKVTTESIDSIEYTYRMVTYKLESKHLCSIETYRMFILLYFSHI